MACGAALPATAAPQTPSLHRQARTVIALTRGDADPLTTRRDTEAAFPFGAKATLLTVGHRLVNALPCRGLAGVTRAFITVAAVLGTRIAPDDGPRRGERPAEVNSARVPVVTDETQAHVLRANALYTDARIAVKVAGTAPGTGIVKARAVINMRTVVVSAFIAIVARARYANPLF